MNENEKIKKEIFRDLSKMNKNNVEDYIPNDAKIAEISEKVISYLKTQGGFRKEEDKIYFLEKSTHRLMQIYPRAVDSEFGHYLNNLCGISEGNAHFTKIYNDIKTEAFVRGIPISVRKYYHYDSKRNAIYFSSNEKVPQIYKIDKNTIQIVENGFDDIYFQHSKHDANLVIDLTRKLDGNCFDKFLTGQIWFEDSVDTKLDKTDQLRLFTWFFYAQFFDASFREKPIPVFLGVKGSGKTTTARSIGTLLYGENFREISLPRDQKDFLSNISNAKYVLIDNVDGKLPTWFADNLASLSTGAGIRGRRLYTNVDDEPMNVRPSCFVALTSRSPKFSREDIASRTIIFKLKKHDLEYSTDFYAGIVENRGDIMLSVFRNLQKILQRLDENKDKHYKHNFRMTEFADFVLKTTSAPEEALRIFKKLREEQSQLALDFVDWLQDWFEILESNSSLEGKELSATAILDQLKRNENFIQLYPRLTSTVIGMQLNNLYDELNNKYNFEIVQRGNNRSYIFSKKDNLKKPTDNSDLVEKVFGAEVGPTGPNI